MGTASTAYIPLLTDIRKPDSTMTIKMLETRRISFPVRFTIILFSLLTAGVSTAQQRSVERGNSFEPLQAVNIGDLDKWNYQSTEKVDLITTGSAEENKTKRTWLKMQKTQQECGQCVLRQPFPGDITSGQSEN